MWWWNLGVPALIGGAYLWTGLATRHRRLLLWRNALALDKVSDVKVSGLWSWRAQITFRSGPLAVRITGVRGGEAKVAVVIEGAEGSSNLELRHQLLELRKQEIAIGDGRLQAELSESELPRFLSDLLDIGQQLADSSEDDASSARALAQAEAGQLSPEHAGIPLRPHATEGFAEPPEVKSWLLHNARRHPKPAVRLFNLFALIREYPGDPDTLKVLRGACLDPISKVRVRAAIELGDEGRNVLLRIAEISSDDASCALAISHLGSTLPLERLREFLSRALRKGFLQMARACLEIFGKSQDPAVFHVLAEVLAREKAELALVAARTLGATGSPAAESPLLLALQREETDLRVAAANALGRIGSAVAVLPLMEAAESADDPSLLHAARQAIAEIQSRLEGAAPGQLSLAAAEAGQLSLAEGEAGRLSLAQSEAGQLSLAHAEAGPLSLAPAEIPLLPHPADEPERPSRNARETLPPES